MNDQTDDSDDDEISTDETSDLPKDLQSGFEQREDSGDSDAAEDLMNSGAFYDSLARTLPYNEDHLDKMFSPLSPETYNGQTIPTTPKSWEVRPSFKTAGKLQIYLPAGTSCLYLNANPVPPATSLSVTATGATPDVAGYYEVNISDSAGPLVLYRWFEPASGATGGWMLPGVHTGQWNMATAAPGSGSWKPAHFILPTIIAVKTSDGVWIPCDNGCMDYEFRAGDAECAAGKYGGTSYAPTLESINSDGNGALQLMNWQAGNSNGTDLSSGPSPALYYSDENGVGGLITLSKITLPNDLDWDVTYDTGGHYFYQKHRAT
jgi:hypothetical protein